MNDRDERFRGYYQKYYWRLVRYFVRVFRCSQEDAEELTQEAFIRFYEAMDEYRGDAEWGFFETIARNLALNRIRSMNTQKRSALVIGIDDPDVVRREPAAAPEPDYAERQQAELRARRLAEAIRELPCGQRECLQLWLEGFTFREIATALRITIDAVKSRLRDARRILRARLGDDGTLPEDET